MTHWHDVQEHMRQRYRLQDDQPDMMSMVWAYDDGRSQKIIVRRFSAFGRQLIELKSAFARREAVEPIELLRKNGELPLATVALSGDVYIAVYNVLIENLVMSDFDLLLSRVAAVADNLEEQYVRQDEF